MPRCLSLASRAQLCCWGEMVVVCALALTVGQIAFMGWMGHVLWPLSNVYWMFLFVTWSGVRLGLMPTCVLLVLVAVQAGWGTLQQRGFFAQDITASSGLGYASFMAILALVGIALASYVGVLRRQKAAARVAAIAFECQEGMLITDDQGRIVRANRSFCAMSGYSGTQVGGRTPEFLWAYAREPEALPWGAVQRQEWHRRTNGQRYPVWVTRTPVANPTGTVTHYVLTMTDLSDWRHRRAERRQREKHQRDALVREVHHRIKNNLQGVGGILQNLAQRHPELRQPLHEVTGQIHAMSLLHGLQGHAPTPTPAPASASVQSTYAEHADLLALLQGVAQSVGTLWGLAIHVQCPLSEQGVCHLQPSEAVPLTLIVHELLVNAVKHGGLAHQDVALHLNTDRAAQQACIAISNPGRWPEQEPSATHNGLELVSALMPRSGATLALQQQGERAVAQLCLHPPLLHIHPDSYAHADDSSPPDRA